jgi:hypothetical protein
MLGKSLTKCSCWCSVAGTTVGARKTIAGAKFAPKSVSVIVSLNELL